MTPTTTCPPANKAHAFSLVEVMISMLAASILAITVSCVLTFGYRSWFRLQQRAGMQRDAATAMDALTSAARAGTNLTFTAGACTVCYDGCPSAAITAHGTNLDYQPNAACPNSLPLVSGTLHALVVNPGSNTSAIVLVLTSNGETVSNAITVTSRNTY